MNSFVATLALATLLSLLSTAQAQDLVLQSGSPIFNAVNVFVYYGAVVLSWFVSPANIYGLGFRVGTGAACAWCVRWIGIKLTAQLFAYQAAQLSTVIFTGLTGAQALAKMAEQSDQFQKYEDSSYANYKLHRTLCDEQRKLLLGKEDPLWADLDNRIKIVDADRRKNLVERDAHEKKWDLYRAAYSHALKNNLIRDDVSSSSAAGGLAAIVAQRSRAGSVSSAAKTPDVMPFTAKPAARRVNEHGLPEDTVVEREVLRQHFINEHKKGKAAGLTDKEIQLVPGDWVGGMDDYLSKRDKLAPFGRKPDGTPYKSNAGRRSK